MLTRPSPALSKKGKRFFGADGAVLFLWDAERERLIARAAAGYELQALSLVALRPGEGIAGKVFESGETIQSNDPTEVAQMLSDLSSKNRRLLLEARGGRRVQAFLCVPWEVMALLTGTTLPRGKG